MYAFSFTILTLPFFINPASANFLLWTSVYGTTSCPAPGQCVPDGPNFHIGITPISDTSCDNINKFAPGGYTGFIPHCGAGGPKFKSDSFRVTTCGFNEIWYGRPGPKVPVLGNSLEISRDKNFKKITAICYANTSPTSNKDDTCKPIASNNCAPRGWLDITRAWWTCFDTADAGKPTCQ